MNGLEFPPFQRVDMAEAMGSDFVEEHLNEPHDITISLQGERHIVEVDGVEVFNFEDDEFTEGTAGYRTWHQTEVIFEEISVTEP